MAIEVGKSLASKAFLEANATSHDYIRDIVVMAGRIDTDILHAPNDNEADIKANELVYALSNGAYTFTADVETDVLAGDEYARAVRNGVADGVMLAMRECGDPKFVDALNTGDTDQIEAVLPPELKVWARDVRNRHITNPEIWAILDQVSITRYTTADQRLLTLGPAGERLDELENKIPAAERYQWELANRTVQSLFVAANLEKNPPPAAGVDYYSQMIEAQRVDAVENFRSWVANLMTSQTFNIMDEAKQKFVTHPEWVDISINKAEWANLVTVANTINKWVFSKLKAQYRPGEMMSPSSELSNISQVEFLDALNLEVNGEKPLLWASREMYQTLLEKDPDFPDDRVDTYRFKDSAKKLLNNRVQMMNDLAQKMVDDGIVDNLDLAKVMVATSYHLFFDVTMVDRADMKRKNNAASIDGNRVEFSPGAKIDAKVGLEVDHDPAGDAAFGKRFFKWSRVLMGLGDRCKYPNGESFKDRMLRLRNERKVAILPRYLNLSWQELQCMEVTAPNGDVYEMSVAQLFMSNMDVAEVHFPKEEEGTDFFCGTYARDQYSAQYNMAQRIIGGKDMLLEMRDERVRNEQLDKFANDRSDLLGKAHLPRGKRHADGHYYIPGVNNPNGSPMKDPIIPTLDKVWNDPVVVARVIQGATPMAEYAIHPEIIIATPENPKTKGEILGLDDWVWSLTNYLFASGFDDPKFKQRVAAELGMKFRTPGSYDPIDSAWWSFPALGRKQKIEKETAELAVAIRYGKNTVRIDEPWRPAP